VRHTLHQLGGIALVSALVLMPARSAAQVPPPVPPPVPPTTTQPPPTGAKPLGGVQPPAGAEAVKAEPGVPAEYTFASGAGMLFFHVQKARAADFETILVRIRTALDQAETPTRKQQALNWKIYKSAETSKDAAIFVFVFDPALTTANYDPLLLLAEVLPAEVQDLYERMKAAVIRIERMGLTKIR
jgi:hypothetical protein